MTREKATLLGLAAYVLAGIFTFGHAAAHHAADPTIFKDGTRFYNTDQTLVGGMLAGMVWPLYWSWEAQRP